MSFNISKKLTVILMDTIQLANELMSDAMKELAINMSRGQRLSKCESFIKIGIGVEKTIANVKELMRLAYVNESSQVFGDDVEAGLRNLIFVWHERFCPFIEGLIHNCRDSGDEPEGASDLELVTARMDRMVAIYHQGDDMESAYDGIFDGLVDGN